MLRGRPLISPPDPAPSTPPAKAPLGRRRDESPSRADRARPPPPATPDARPHVACGPQARELQTKNPGHARRRAEWHKTSGSGRFWHLALDARHATGRRHRGPGPRAPVAVLVALTSGDDWPRGPRGSGGCWRNAAAERGGRRKAAAERGGGGRRPLRRRKAAVRARRWSTWKPRLGSTVPSLVRARHTQPCASGGTPSRRRGWKYTMSHRLCSSPLRY